MTINGTPKKDYDAMFLALLVSRLHTRLPSTLLDFSALEGSDHRVFLIPDTPVCFAYMDTLGYIYAGYLNQSHLNPPRTVY